MWHWSDIPESVLIDSGFSSSTSELRRLRERNQGQIPEFGLDGIAMHEDGTYHGIQAKLWRTVLCASNLGTFLSVVYGRMRKKNNASTGYLYHTGTLDHQLRTDVLLMTNIVAKHLVYPMDVIQSKDNSTLRVIEDRAVQTLVNAVRSKWQGAAQLHMPYGLPTDTITARFLDASFAHTSTTIVVASSMHQARRRVLKQLRQVIPYDRSNPCPDIISTTHGSMHNLFHLNAFFIINDAHMLEQQAYPERCLLISNEVLHGIPTLFTYTMEQAIDRGLVCDYAIHLPLEEKIDVPCVMTGHGSYETAFALFLTSGMLQTGSHRCVVYASSEESRSIVAAFTECCGAYHHMMSSSYIIDRNHSQRAKGSIIERFNTDEHNVVILVCTGSVQTAVAADSVCITEGSMITRNALQYVCSTNQIYTMRPSKVANAFIYSRDTAARRELLSSLHTGDSNALSRIQLVANYETKANAAARTEQLESMLLSANTNASSAHRCLSCRKGQHVE